MQITHEQITGETMEVTLISVTGPSLNASNSKTFKAEIAPVLQSAKRLVIDMSAVQFVDSSGLGAILSCLRQLNEHGADMKVFGLSKSVRALFELVRIHKVIDIHNSKEEAISAFAG